MQVWQLFHILQDYCNITKENPSLYCNMIKHLLQKQKIHGKQTIHSLTHISPTHWQAFFRDSIFTHYHAEKLQAIIKHVDEYLTTHGITSILLQTTRNDYTLTSLSKSIQSTTPKPNNVCNVAISLVAGFGIGCLCTWFMNNNQHI